MGNNNCAALTALMETIAKLTGPDGCPWDKAQTPASLADYLVEEVHELVAAIRAQDEAGICEELGDVFFLLLFMAQYFQKQGAFTLSEALLRNQRKMIGRHPHVFADVKFANLDEQLKAWDAIKKTEHVRTGVFASLPDSLPPLIKAYRIHSRAARAGFTWPSNEDAERQVEAEWLEWLDAVESDDREAQAHELGDIIFSLVELGRRHGIKANEALDFATRRFLARFKRMEELAKEQGADIERMNLAAQDVLWIQAKEELQERSDH